jgi:hypothetical protein
MVSRLRIIVLLSLCILSGCVAPAVVPLVDLRHPPTVGMTMDEVRERWGDPSSTEHYTLRDGPIDHWKYEVGVGRAGHYVVSFENGVAFKVNDLTYAVAPSCSCPRT